MRRGTSETLGEPALVARICAEDIALRLTRTVCIGLFGESLRTNSSDALQVRVMIDRNEGCLGRERQDPSRAGMVVTPQADERSIREYQRPV